MLCVCVCRWEQWGTADEGAGGGEGGHPPLRPPGCLQQQRRAQGLRDRHHLTKPQETGGRTLWQIEAMRQKFKSYCDKIRRISGELIDFLASKLLQKTAARWISWLRTCTHSAIQLFLFQEAAAHEHEDYKIVKNQNRQLSSRKCQAFKRTNREKMLKGSFYIIFVILSRVNPSSKNIYLKLFQSDYTLKVSVEIEQYFSWN